jgi:DNA-directed RNA polymerase specialized sigma subunit
MNYISEAIERLKHLKDLEIAKENLKDTILDLKLRCQGTEITLDGMPQGRSSVTYDDAIINNMFKLQESQKRLRETIKEIEKIHKELSRLDEKDRELLVQWFVEKKGLQDLCKIYKCEKTTLYRKRDAALKQFAVQLFGIRVIS